MAVATPTVAGEPAAPRRRGVLARLVRDRTALPALVVFCLVVIAAALAPWLAPHDPFAVTRAPFLTPVWGMTGSWAHILGTDGQGRDILSRLLYGTRLTLLAGLASVLIGGVIGMLMGMLAAFYRWLDPFLMRLVDVLLSFPAILFGLALAAIFGPGLGPIVIALSIATVPDVARVTRGVAVGVMAQDYMEAGRAVGLSDATLIRRYLARNCLSSVFVFMTLRFGQVILLGAALSFLGLGARPPTAELGMMAAQGRDFLFFAPHIATIPSVAIFVIVLAANMVGDSLRDVLDPRLRS
ncbi:ABC transporter permease [Marinivivus vitaminiproducens]|uniref:ABC transporter permease n=1 Tax=Marinivivus vitaminiproducens TaxID=3035935 RepID=UPI0027A29184|nr:ABC transporter permease [Geminicoccaceae bacterium SCSIO 64248]